MTQTLLLVLLVLFSSTAWAEDYQKSFSKNYTVKPDAKVALSSQYGNLAIETWDKDQVDIKVTVTVKKLSEKDARQLLDKVDVTFSGNNDLVKAETKINGRLNCRDCEFSIDYEVKMPASSNLDIKNEFGNAVVPSMTGSLAANIRYGNLNTGKLENKENKISLKFGNMEIDHAQAAEVEMEYGALEIGSAGYLDLYARFTSIELGEVSELLLDGQYEDMEIGSVNMMRAKVSFMGIEIGELFDKLELTTSYGGLGVDRVASGFSSIDITSEFGDVDLGISGSASYALRIESEFGDIEYPESKTEVTKLVEKNFHKELDAFVGSDRASTSTVIIRGRNGGIEID